MPIDPKKLSDLLRSDDLSPDTIEGSSQQPQPQVPQDPTAPGVQDQSPNPQQALSSAQPSQPQQVPSGLQSMFGKDVPESMTNSLLRGIFQQSPTIQPQIQPFQDNQSPARSILTSVVNGLTASTIGQRFFTTRAQRYKEWKDLQDLRLQQQQRDQQMQLGQLNTAVKMVKEQNTQQFHQQLNDFRTTRNTDLRNYQQGQLQARLGMNDIQFQRFLSQDAQFKAIQQHMQNQDANAVNPASKDPEYIRALGLVGAQYKANQQDPTDPSIYPKFLQDVNDQAQVFKAQQAAMKPQNNEPKPVLGVDPNTNQFVTVRPGQPVPPGFRTVTQEGQVNIPTTTTRTKGEQGGIIQTAGEHLIDVLNQNRDAVGNMEAYWKKAKNNTPFADPTQSYINNLLQSYIALQPALHGFRSQEAMQHFEKSIGGTPKNVDALIAAIKANNETGGIINLAGKGQKPSAGVEKWVRDKNGNLVKQ